MNSTCGCNTTCSHSHFGLFILRAVAGFIFIFHGLSKFQNLTGTKSFFVGLHLVPWVAEVVASIELVGGIALVLGLFTCIVAPILAIDMAVAVVLVTWANAGWYSSELEILLIASMIAIKCLGPGRYKVPGGCGCPMCKGGENCANCGHKASNGNMCDCTCHK